MNSSGNRALQAFLDRVRPLYATPREALGLSLPDRLYAVEPSQALSHYWRRSRLRAVAARELATVVRWNEGDEAFAAGLLADVGIAVLLHEAMDDYAPLYEGAQAGDLDLIEAERRVFQFDHGELTQRLLEEWRLPAAMAATIAEARDGRDPALTLRRAARLVDVAERWAAVMFDDRADLWPALVEGAERHLRLTADDLAALGPAIEAKTSDPTGPMKVPQVSDGAVRALFDRAGQTAAVVVEPKVAPQRVSGAGDLGRIHDSLRAAATECRRERAPLCLCLVEIEADGKIAERRASAAVGAACRAVDWPGALITTLGATRTALVWPRCDRRSAVKLFDELRTQFRAKSVDDGTATKLSAGMAVVGLPPRDFPVDEVVAAAERCLYAARSSAGDIVKSIELY